MNTTPPITAAVDIAKGLPKGGLGTLVTATKAKLYAGLVAPLQGAWHILKGVPVNLLDKAINQGYDMANSARAGYQTFAVGPRYLKWIPGLVGGALGLGGGTVLYGVSNTIDAGADLARSSYDIGLARADLVKSTYTSAKDTATLFADQRDLKTSHFLKNSRGRFTNTIKYGFQLDSGKRKGFKRLRNSFRRTPAREPNHDAIIVPIDRNNQDTTVNTNQQPDPPFYGGNTATTENDELQEAA